MKDARRPTTAVKLGLTSLLVCGALVASASVASAQVTAAQAIAALNAQREAHGIPAGIVENPAWSDGCAKHVAYMRRNDVVEHEESRSRPGYTPEGDEAAANSVLEQHPSASWAVGNPWEDGPMHLHQLLGPRLSVTGIAEGERYGCAYTWPGYQRPAPATWLTYTYPGPGTTGYRIDEVAAEIPHTPGSLVGIPEGTKSGPYLFVMFDGPFSTAETVSGSATLTGPAGPVEVLVVGNHTAGVGGFIPVGLEIIPRRPLRVRSTYTASVTATVAFDGDNVQQVTHSWSFTTGARPNSVSLDVRRNDQRSASIDVEAYSSAPDRSVVITGPDGTTLTPRLKRGRATVVLPKPGKWRACVASGGDHSAFDLATRCRTVTAPAHLDFDLPQRVSGGRLSLRVPAALVGRKARITAQVMHRGGFFGSSRKTVTLRRRTTVPLPTGKPGGTWQVEFKTASFTARGIRYERLSLLRSYDTR